MIGQLLQGHGWLRWKHLERVYTQKEPVEREEEGIMAGIESEEVTGGEAQLP